MEIENLRQKKGLMQHVHMLTHAYIHYTHVSAMVFCFKNCLSDREKILKFEPEAREFAKILRSLEQFVLTAKGQYHF